MKLSRYLYLFLVFALLFVVSVLIAPVRVYATDSAQEARPLFAVTLTPSPELPTDVPPVPTEVLTSLPTIPTAAPTSISTPTAVPTSTPVVTEAPPAPTQTPEPVSEDDPAPAPVILPAAGLGAPETSALENRGNLDTIFDTLSSTPRDSSMQLIIPEMGLSAPIQPVVMAHGYWDIRFIGDSIAWLSETTSPGDLGNSVLVAHVSGASPLSPFRFLEKLEPGSLVWVDTEQAVYVYEVHEQRVVEPQDTSVLSSGDRSQLTLLTCTDWDKTTNLYLKRRIVTADLISTIPRLDNALLFFVR